MSMATGKWPNIWRASTSVWWNTTNYNTKHVVNLSQSHACSANVYWLCHMCTFDFSNGLHANPTKTKNRVQITKVYPQLSFARAWGYTNMTHVSWQKCQCAVELYIFANISGFFLHQNVTFTCNLDMYWFGAVGTTLALSSVSRCTIGYDIKSNTQIAGVEIVVLLRVYIQFQLTGLKAVQHWIPVRTIAPESKQSSSCKHGLNLTIR